MEQDELLRHVVEALDRLEIRYLVTGSIAAMFHGEPRLTNDIDVVVRLTADKVDALETEFPPEEFYFDREAALEGAEGHTQFNVIHPRSGLKVDFMVAAPTPFNESRFARARSVRAAEDLDASFATPEDIIVMKMDYFRRGGSEKHLRDIAGIIAVSGDDLDLDYIERWTRELDLLDVWRRVRSS